MTRPADLYTARLEAARLLSIIDGRAETDYPIPEALAAGIREVAAALRVVGYSWDGVPFYASRPVAVLEVDAVEVDR